MMPHRAKGLDGREADTRSMERTFDKRATVLIGKSPPMHRCSGSAKLAGEIGLLVLYNLPNSVRI